MPTRKVEGYDAYFEAVLQKLAPHGLIVADNTLQGGWRARQRHGSQRVVNGIA